MKLTASVLAFLLIIFVNSGAFAQSRGGDLEIVAPNGEVVGKFSEAYALVIGESNYTNGWDRLPGVKDDVAAVKQLFEECGFTVKTIQDVNSRELRDGITKFLDDYGYNRDARLILYFAGHGASLTLNTNSKMGYIVPVDAPHYSRDEAAFKRSAIAMEQFNTWAKTYDARHILFLFDSCFSGSIFRDAERNPPPPAISRLIAQPVRQFITAGEADEKVPDQSVFRRQLEAALRYGLADSDKDGYVSGTELGTFLYNTVSNYMNGKQNPHQAKLNDTNLDKGDFIFEVGTRSVTSTGGGSVLVESDIAGEIFIDGKATGRRIKAGGTETITGVSTGYTEVAVREDSGAIIKAPQTVMVRQGQTTAVVIERPVPEELAFEVVDGKSVTITKYSGNAITVNIPERIQGLPVTVIGDRAFRYCSGLTSITIPSSVTTIENYAFYNCSSLTGVTIPSSVTAIGNSAFSYCSSLTSVTISSSVTEISTGAFENCTSLTSITVDSRNSAYTSVDGVLFDKNVRTLITYPGGKKGNYDIPSSVTVIGGSAFYRCSSLTSVTIPSSVTTIGDDAFYRCSSLTSVTIPSSVTTIGKWAFYSCSSLTSVTLSRRTQVGEGAFPATARIRYSD